MNLVRILKAQWDRAAGVGLVAAGLVALLVGWLGASRTGFPAEQIPYIISGGMLALCLIAVGTTLWLSADLRDEWCRIDQLDSTIREQTAVLERLSAVEARQLVGTSGR